MIRQEQNRCMKMYMDKNNDNMQHKDIYVNGSLNRDINKYDDISHNI